jgi:hypothetical protein
MGRVGFNPKGGRIKSDAGVSIDRAFLAHFHVPAAQAVAADSDAILPFTNLGAAAKSITSGFAIPAVPRNAQVDGSAANMTGNVKLYGLRAGKEITETIALDGTTAKAGNLAFDVITKADLPVRTNTPAKQKGTVAVSAGASAAGTVVLTVTGAALPGETHTKTVDVPVTADDNTTAEVATKIAAALNADEVVSEHYTAAAVTANVTLEAKVEAAQDANLNIVVTDDDSTSVALGSIDVDTVAGVAPDQISIGWGKKFGLPYKLSANELVILKLFGNAKETTEGTVTADANDLEKNVYEPNGAPDGQNDIDLYIVV